MLLWQVITVVAMLGFMGFAYHAFLPVLGGEFSWTSFGARAFITATIFVLVAYGVKQADRFFELEKTNRRLALELEAIRPYLADLPEQLQNDFRVEVGRRSFGQAAGFSVGSNDVSPATLLDLIKSKELKDLIVSIIKASR